MEQTSWIRSSKAVKAELQIETEEDLDPNDASTKLSDLIDANTETSSTTSGEGAPQKKSLTQYAVIFFKCQITFFCFFIEKLYYLFSFKKIFLGPSSFFTWFFTCSTLGHVSTFIYLKSVAKLKSLLYLVFLYCVKFKLFSSRSRIYSSDEKDKVVPLLSNVMINVVPYLKNHSRSNLAFYRACSRLLASLSEYQNTRKAWKKEAMELLIDPVFFQIDLTSLRHWKTTVDNLMTHDKTTFKDLMSRLFYFISFIFNNH